MNYTLNEWVVEWIKTYKAIMLKPSTYDTYLQHAKSVSCSKPLRALESSDIQLIINEMVVKGRSIATIKHVLTLIRQSLYKARRLGYIADLRCLDDLELPRGAGAHPVLAMSLLDINRLQANCNDTLYGDLYLFLLYTGMRVGEAIALQWPDIDFFSKKIYIRHTDYKGKLQTVKTSSGLRCLPMGDNIEKILLKQLKRKSAACSRVFTNSYGSQINYRSLLKSWHRYLDKIHVPPAGLHVLRHSFAHYAIRNGIAVKVVSAWLGHADVTITIGVYDNVTVDDLEQAAELSQDMFYSKKQKAQ